MVLNYFFQLSKMPYQGPFLWIWLQWERASLSLLRLHVWFVQKPGGRTTLWSRRCQTPASSFACGSANVEWTPGSTISDVSCFRQWRIPIPISQSFWQSLLHSDCTRCISAQSRCYSRNSVCIHVGIGLMTKQRQKLQRLKLSKAIFLHSNCICFVLSLNLTFLQKCKFSEWHFTITCV